MREHTVKGPHLPKIIITEASHARHFILLFIAFNYKDIFFLLHYNQQHYVSIFFHMFFFFSVSLETFQRLFSLEYFIGKELLPFITLRIRNVYVM